MKKPFLLFALIAFSAGLLAESAMAEEARRLRILLTNDDGYDAPGIQAMYRVLVDKGHHVTIVAPSDNQSGTGVITTARPIDIVKKGEDSWAISGRPADAVLVGLDYLLRGNPPDLVVSGANFGANVGISVFHSGTVGAAIMAMRRGVPAIAVSVGVRSDEKEAEPPFKSTLGAFEDAGEFTAQMVERLNETRSEGGHLLPDGTILNLNYPALPVGERKAVKWTRLGRGAFIGVSYREVQGTGALQLAIEFLEPKQEEEPVVPADTVLFNRGHITVSVLDGDWTAEAVGTQLSLADRLADLTVPAANSQQ